jgi:hypothetical protein
MLAVGKNEQLAERLASGQDMAMRFMMQRRAAHWGVSAPQFDQFGRPLGSAPPTQALYMSFSATPKAYNANAANLYASVSRSSTGPVATPIMQGMGRWGTIQLAKSNSPVQKRASPLSNRASQSTNGVGAGIAGTGLAQFTAVRGSSMAAGTIANPAGSR